MNMEQQFQEVITPMASTKVDCASSLDKCRSISSEIDGSVDNSSTTGGFDCNICLDSVQDPVVTLCGHLYCWPCIYKWIHYQGTDETLDHHHQQKPQCPVCKAEVSKGTLIPLYGRGATPKPSEGKAPHLGITVPKRPPSMMTCGFSNTETSTSPLHHRRRRHSPPRSPQQHQQSPNTATTMGGGMIGEMVYARIFGNSTLDSYGHPDSYNVGANANPRLRRHLMQTDQSLGRVCFFLFCCVVLCLLLF